MLKKFKNGAGWNWKWRDNVLGIVKAGEERRTNVAVVGNDITQRAGSGILWGHKASGTKKLKKDEIDVLQWCILLPD